MAFSCVMPGENIRVFAKSLIAISKFSDEIYWESKSDILIVNAINSNRTAFVSFEYSHTFFACYTNDEGETQLTQNVCTCKMPIRGLLALFKNSAALEKEVETCKFELKQDSDSLIITFKYKDHVTKTHHMRLYDKEQIEAFNYLKKSKGYVNRMSGLGTTLMRAFNNFHTSDNEVIFETTSTKLIVRNFLPSEMSAHLDAMRTKLIMQKCEFSNYVVGNETSIRFLLKQFRAAIAFGDAFMLPVAFCFQAAGKALVVNVKNNATFDAHFVLATVAESMEEITPSTTQVNTSQVSLSKKRKATSDGHDGDEQQRRKIHNNDNSLTDQNGNGASIMEEHLELTQLPPQFFNNQLDEGEEEHGEKIARIVMRRFFETDVVKDVGKKIVVNSDSEDI